MSPDTLQTPVPYPLFERYPRLGSIPRAKLCVLPSPVEDLATIADELWIKRDDTDAPLCGGNKVRALELLLGGLKEGDTIVTVGGAGSTHVLSTARHAARLGVSTIAAGWTHEMNPVADEISLRIAAATANRSIHMSPVLALATARYLAVTRRLRYIPIGGSTPLGILGHVNAALELAGQIRRNEAPMPARIVIPLGSGGTVAGLLLGFAIAGMDIDIVGARVGPRMFVNRRRVLMLARRTARLIASLTGEQQPSIDVSRLRIVHHVYAGAYGRPHARTTRAADILHEATGIRLDDTYSGKAWIAALDETQSAPGPVLFWLTFDASCLTN